MMDSGIKKRVEKAVPICLAAPFLKLRQGRAKTQTTTMQPQTLTLRCRQQGDATTSRTRGTGGHGADDKVM
jgi:hypothetical protein